MDCKPLQTIVFVYKRVIYVTFSHLRSLAFVAHTSLVTLGMGGHVSGLAQKFCNRQSWREINRPTTQTRLTPAYPNCKRLANTDVLR